MSDAQQFFFAGQGPLIIGEYDPVNGSINEAYLVNQKRVGCGNRTLKITLSRDVKKIAESDSGQSLTVRRWTSGQSANIQLDMAQFSRDELALGLYGSAVSHVAGTVTGESLRNNLAAGDIFHLKYPLVSDLVLTDSAGTPAGLTLGQHYAQSADDAKYGRASVLDLTGLTQPIKAAYSYDAHGSVNAFTAKSTRRGIIFDGINIAEDNAPVRVFVPLADFNPTKEFNWLSTDEAVLSLEGEVLYCAELVGSDFGPYFRMDALPV